MMQSIDQYAWRRISEYLTPYISLHSPEFFIPIMRALLSDWEKAEG